MIYLGSKRRMAPFLLPIILKDRTPDQWYCEPMVGGGNMIENVEGPRIGADINKYLIACLKQSQKDGFEVPYISEAEYLYMNKNRSEFPDWLLGFVGFQLSFGGKFFAGYKRDGSGIRDFSDEGKRNFERQIPKIKTVEFYNCNYWEMPLPLNSIVYCDPPYEGTQPYKNQTFDHKGFWSWCDLTVEKGYSVFVSEYHAPEGWECVFEKEVTASFDIKSRKRETEKLFVKKP